MKFRWFGTMIGFLAVAVPVVTLALLVERQRGETAPPLAPGPTPPAAASRPILTDEAVPLAANGTPPKTAEASPDLKSTGNSPGTPSELKLPTIDELSPRGDKGGSHSSTESPTVMPRTIAPPFVGEPTAGTPPEGEVATPVDSKMRRREGTYVREVVGTIEKNGLELILIPLDHSAPLHLLQNQLLERLETYQETTERLPKDAFWRMSGRVTEYRGANFLLLTAFSQIDSPPKP